MRLVMIGITFIFFLGAWVVKAETSPAPHPFDVRDLVTLDRISGDQVSPDGKWVAFELRKVNLEANKGIRNLWIVGTDGKGLRRLTNVPANEYNVCWAKDSKTIYYISENTGSSQVWKLSIAGGEAVQVTKLPLDVANLALSPDGTKMAFSLDIYFGMGIEETVKKDEERKKIKATGRIYTSLFIRHWDSWGEGKRTHIFVMPVEGGTPVDIMKTMDADSPTKPFGDQSDFTFTPDSKGIVFSAADTGREESWSTNTDLFFVPIDGAQAPKCLTSANKARDQRPIFSPDGKTLAYLAMKRPGYEADRLYLTLLPWPEGKAQILAEKWDRSIDNFVWSPDGKTIYALAANLGQTPLFAIDVKTAEVKALVKEGNVKSIGIAGKQIIYGMDHLKSPVDLYSVDMLGKKSVKITDANAEKLASIKFGEPEQFKFKGWNNDDVYAYIVKPVDFDPQKKYPVAYLIHGGPQGSMANDFHYRWNPQTYAARGYVALMVDFHASAGYGQAFMDAIQDDWGGKPLEDLQKGLAAAIEKYPFMDGDRVAALGASYGGFMINWIQGNWPDRFKCLVCHDGNLDERMAYYDTEELWFPEWEHKGTPWENPEGYTKHNPIDHVSKWKTPMLVVHGGKDYRVVDTQGISTFTALQRKGIPSKFLYFPDENHWVLKPQNSILWHDTVLDWLDQWTKK